MGPRASTPCCRSRSSRDRRITPTAVGALRPLADAWLAADDRKQGYVDPHYVYLGARPRLSRNLGGVPGLRVTPVDAGRLVSKPEKIIKEKLGPKDVHLSKSPGHQRDWLNCLRTRARPIADVEIGARSVTVCHLGNLAYWHRQTLKWDPKKWQFVGGAGNAAWLDHDRRAGYVLPKV